MMFQKTYSERVLIDLAIAALPILYDQAENKKDFDPYDVFCDTLSKYTARSKDELHEADHCE